MGIDMVNFKTRCGTEFYIDEDIFQEICKFTWRVSKDGYIFRKTTIGGKKGRNLMLHRVVLRQSDPTKLVDHIDGNKLNNLRSNLRIASKGENTCNQMKTSNTSSQFKGVTLLKKNKWRAQIQINKKRFYLGEHDNEHDAAHAYNKAAIRLHGDFARLNPVGFKGDCLSSGDKT
ncbi:AP2/ERF family transcription factor [Curvibacter lanceolatus]|uniref:AP2/ERF family transcription factor n=1 Tax=Curvibacter lanceolatus TaxID=86182 RepID=UPI00146EB997|nr:AP2/ERF family transcription factor [Curvibacter lanceolatus]